MADPIARALTRLCALLFPHRGKHRAALTPEPPLAPVSRPRRPLPAHKSPYARDAAEQRPFVDTLKPVRPYVTAPPSRRPEHPHHHVQAERRWVLDMALRGIDVGPTTIHGVHVQAGSRTLRVPMAA